MLKLSYDKVQRLKKMNDTYPKCTSDYDGNFVLYLLDFVFDKPMLKDVADRGSLRVFPVIELQFVKSMASYFILK